MCVCVCVLAGYTSVISQIPGLSSTLRSLPEEKSQGRRFRVLDSDSEYVKLAKQGGHKGVCVCVTVDDSLCFCHFSH